MEAPNRRYRRLAGILATAIGGFIAVTVLIALVCLAMVHVLWIGNVLDRFSTINPG
jgi:uncharacterized membrane protein YbhN (UPF0104 family)